VVRFLRIWKEMSIFADFLMYLRQKMNIIQWNQYTKIILNHTLVENGLDE